MSEQLFQVKKQLMGLLGGIYCQNCRYDQFQALLLTYKEYNGSKDNGSLNIVRYQYYLIKLEQAKQDLEILCYNCLRRKMNRRSKNNNQYQKYGKKYDKKQRKQIMSLLNQYSCVNCGEGDFEVLEINHIKGIGGRLFKLFKSKRKEWLYYIKNPQKVREDLEILCKNCNKLKQYGLLHVLVSDVIA